ncbi:MAG: sterol desaturase family protein, partial [Flavobacteriales bacterium]
HELHHSDAELNVTSSFRTHWLETPVQFLFVVLPCYYLLGVDVLGYAICTLIIVAQLLLTHSNLKLGYGWFTRFLCSPQMHRIHHSILPKHKGKNLCQMFPVFDILFNTYYHPKKEEYPPTGLDSLPSDASIGYVMKKPLEDWLDQIEKK